MLWLKTKTIASSHLLHGRGNGRNLNRAHVSLCLRVISHLQERISDFQEKFRQQYTLLWACGIKIYFISCTSVIVRCLVILSWTSLTASSDLLWWKSLLAISLWICLSFSRAFESYFSLRPAMKPGLHTPSSRTWQLRLLQVLPYKDTQTVHSSILSCLAQQFCTLNPHYLVTVKGEPESIL